MALMARRVGWVLMVLAGLALALGSARYFLPSMPAAFPQQADLYRELRPLLLAHVGGGIVAILCGPWQFWTAFRARFIRLHRWVGRAYLAGVAFGATAGFFLAPWAHGGAVTPVGFTGLALAWAGTSFMAYRNIRVRRIEAHREWMIRSYAVALAFVFLRLWLPLLGGLGVPFDEAYQTVSWLCWVPNLVVAELYLGARRGARRAVA